MSSRSWRRVSCSGPGSGKARVRASRILVMYSALKADSAQLGLEHTKNARQQVCPLPARVL